MLGRLIVVVLVLGLVAGACGGDAELEIEDVWARTSASSQDNGAVYMTITGGDAADRLVGVSVGADVAGMAQLHESSMNDQGVMSMEQVPEISVAADGTVMLEPGGFHVMLMNLAEPLQAGDEIDVTLMFQEAGEIEVTAEVRDN